MPDQYDSLIDEALSGGDEYDSLIDEALNDAVAPPRQASDSGEALLTNLPTQGFGQNVVRSLPAAGVGFLGAAGGAKIGAGIGTALGGPGIGTVIGGGVGAVGGAFAGGAGGELLRQGAARATSALFPQEQFPSASAGEISRRAAGEGLAQAGGQAIGGLAGPAVRAVGRGLVSNPIAQAVGGTTREAAERLLSRAQQVVSKIGSADEMGKGMRAAATQFKEAIAENLDLAGEKYRQLINTVIGPESRLGPGFRLNLQSGIGDDVARIGKESGYGVPGRLTDNADANKFLGFAKRANELSDATADEVYWFQRDLNNALMENNSQALNRHLGKLKGSLNKYLDNSLPEIREANTVYREASDVAESLSKVENADDAAKTIISRYRAPGSDTRQAIVSAAERLPAAQQALDALLDQEAAQAFSPRVASVPRTGFALFAPGVAATNLISTPLAVAAGTAGLSGVSPRLTALVARGAQATTKAIPQFSPGALLGTGASPLAQEYMRRRPAQ